MKPRLLIIGLDGADPSLVFDRFATRMPCISRLAKAGRYGPLRSTEPPITMPAWVSMFTGLDPGELGLYGFRNRAGYDYRPLALSQPPGPVEAPRVWDTLAASGLTCHVLGVPGTYPPWPIRGRMVSGFLAPDRSAPFVWPRSYRAELDRLAGPGGYLLDAQGYRDLAPEALAEQVTEMTRRRFRVAQAWAAEPDWDLMAMVEMGPDRMHHGLWRFSDPAHRLYRPGNAHEQALPDYYAFLDKQIEGLVAAAGEQTAILVVSDHGARAMQGAFAVNQWLIEQGDLVLNESPTQPGPLDPARVDWGRTRAWGEGGYAARIMLNRIGREALGTIPADGVETYLADLIERLTATEDENGQALGTRVLRPDQCYRQLRGRPPDLLVTFGNLGWRAVNQVGGSVHLRGEVPGADDANHAQDGICLFFDPWRQRGDHPIVRDLIEIAPLVLNFFGLGEGELSGT